MFSQENEQHTCFKFKKFLKAKAKNWDLQAQKLHRVFKNLNFALEYLQLCFCNSNIRVHVLLLCHNKDFPIVLKHGKGYALI